MTEPRVIRADFATWRPVAGRKVLQLVLEVPIEQTKDVLDKLGVPTPGESRWVAVALLSPEAAQAKAPAPSGSSKPDRKWSDLPLSQQAGIRCDEPAFQDFIYSRMPPERAARKEWTVADEVRYLCGCEESRSEIKPNTVPGQVWQQLEVKYQAHLADKQFAGARR